MNPLKFTLWITLSLLLINLHYSCTQDNFDDLDVSLDSNGDQGEEGDLYISFSLSMPDGVPSRADESGYGGSSGNQYTGKFEDGTDEENKINNILILFFKQDGKQCYSLYGDGLVVKETNGETGLSEKKEWNKTFILSAEESKTFNETSLGIDKFITIVNYDETILNAVKGENLSTVTSVTVGNYKTSNGFVMTTTGHYDSDKNYICYNTKSDDPDQQLFYNSKSMAEKNPVSIYVERLAARIDVNVKEDVEGIDVLYGTDVFSLIFKPGDFGLESQEKTSYLLKNQITPSSAFTSTSYHSDFYDWINYENKRTFWAESPNFTTKGTYPVKGDGSENNLTMNYQKFGEINNKIDKTSTNPAKSGYKTGSAYILEHTFPVSEVSSATNPYAVPTSMVIKGYYTVKYKTTDEVEAGDRLQHPEDRRDDASGVDTNSPAYSIGDTLNLNGSGFYLRNIDMERTDKEASDSKRYRCRLYRENNGATTASTDVNKINYDKQKDDLFNALLKEQLVVFVKQEESYVPVRSTTTYKYLDGGIEKTDYLADKIFEIQNTQLRWNNNGSSSVSSNTYTLQLKAGSIPSGVTLYYAVYPDPSKQPTQSVAKYEQVTSINDVNTINTMLQKQLGYAQKYFQGYAFFYAPITHYTGDEKPYSSYTGLFKYNNQGSLDHKTGDFGIVRNHVYDLTIGKFSTLGYGIPSNDHIPLPEPMTEHDIYQFDIELKILPWNVFEYTLDI